MHIKRSIRGCVLVSLVAVHLWHHDRFPLRVVKPVHCGHLGYHGQAVRHDEQDDEAHKDAGPDGPGEPARAVDRVGEGRVGEVRVERLDLRDTTSDLLKLTRRSHVLVVGGSNSDEMPTSGANACSVSRKGKTVVWTDLRRILENRLAKAPEPIVESNRQA